MAFSSTLLIIVLYVLVALFIYGVIGQMHVNVLHVATFWTLIWLCCESGESFFEEVDLHRIYPIQQHINSQIKLEPPQQVRRVNIMLRYHVIMRRHILPSIRKKNALTLTLAFGLYYEDFIFLGGRLLGLFFLLLLFVVVTLHLLRLLILNFLHSRGRTTICFWL